MSDPLNLPTFGQTGELNVVVETPRGASVKLKYEPKERIFTVARALPVGMAYPFDWGFVPQTLAPDGDPLDVLGVHDFATYPGVVLPCRPLGVVLLDQG